MCFVLYAGTSDPIPRKDWRNDAPDVSVTSLTERESPITRHFSKPHVQCVGSTSQCGCDFPHVMYQNGGWPWLEYDDAEEVERQKKESENFNRERLIATLQHTGEPTIELYGIWDGDFDFTTPPRRFAAHRKNPQRVAAFSGGKDRPSPAAHIRPVV